MENVKTYQNHLHFTFNIFHLQFDIFKIGRIN